MWKSSCCKCPAGHKTAGLWKCNREREGEMEIFLKGQRKRRERERKKNRICVKCIFCIHPNSLKSCYSTWSWKIKVSLFACPSWTRLFSAHTGPILHFTKTRQPCIFSDLVVRLVVRRGCHFRAPAGRLLFLLGHCDAER